MDAALLSNNYYQSLNLCDDKSTKMNFDVIEVSPPLSKEDQEIAEQNVDSVILSTPLPKAPKKHWRISDNLALLSMISPFKLKEFNHLTRECLDLDVSVAFYCNLLGFRIVPRPPFESVGTWLWGHNLNLHLIQTKKKKERQVSDILRLMHYKGMPIADHFAFLVDNIWEVEAFLDEYGIFYYRDNNEATGTYQLFLFDPDFNVVEISNCAPPVGEVKCHNNAIGSTENSCACSIE